MSNVTSQPLDPKQTADQLRGALEKVNRMRAALAKVGPPAVDRPASEAINDARRAHEDALAAQALGEADASVVADARKRYDLLVKADQAAAAKASADDDIRDGLRRRLIAAEAELETSSSQHDAAVRAAQMAWALAELETAEVKYAERALQVADYWARAQGLRVILERLGRATAGSPAFRLEPNIPVIGILTAEIARRNRPNESTGGYVWGCTVQPRADNRAVMDAIAAEIADLDLHEAGSFLSNDGGDQPSTGVVGKVIQRIAETFAPAAAS